MADITKIFNGPLVIAPEAASSPEDQLREAMRLAGIEPPGSLYLDGRIHRFSTNGKHDDKAGWYVVYPDGIHAGRFGDWRTGVNVQWSADPGRPLSFAEQKTREKRIEEAKIAREKEDKKLKAVVADTVAQIWDGCTQASPEHPYLKRKGVQPHGARVAGDGRLILPLYDEKGELVTLQYIKPDGGKRYHTGGPTAGKFWIIGEPGKTIYLAEGFATAASIHEATRCAVAIAYSANNLVNVAGLLREKYGPEQEIVIVADNDESGAGQKCASQAGSRWGMKVVIPPMIGDANDYVQAGHDLLQILYPDLDNWLIPADEFCLKPAPLGWLVKHWVQENALIMVHGPSGGGKTFIVLDWCLYVSSGLPFWGKHKVKEAPVVYLAGEGHHGLKARIAAWKEYNKVDSVNMWLSRDGCDLNTPAGYGLVVDHVRALPEQPKLIVVDTLHRFLLGDENSAQDTKTMLDACAGLMKEFSCSVILVHHTGVSEETQHRARGSSAWRGALDIEVSVIPGKFDGPLQLVQRKSKDAELTEPLWFDLQSVQIPGWYDEDGEQVTSAVVVESSEPVKAKKDSKVAGYMKMFQRAWFASGEEMSDDHKPFVSRKAMLDFLVENDGNTEAAAKQMVKPGATGRYIGCLINGEIIEAKCQKGNSGWQVVDNNLISTMLIQSKQNGVRL